MNKSHVTLSCVWIASMFVACASQQQAVTTAKSSVQLADDACVVIHDVDPNGKVDGQICATETELKSVLSQIVAGRAAGAAKALAADAGK